MISPHTASDFRFVDRTTKNQQYVLLRVWQCSADFFREHAGVEFFSMTMARSAMLNILTRQQCISSRRDEAWGN
jgi:hypothetical protein